MMHTRKKIMIILILRMDDNVNKIDYITNKAISYYIMRVHFNLFLFVCCLFSLLAEIRSSRAVIFSTLICCRSIYIALKIRLPRDSSISPSPPVSPVRYCMFQFSYNKIKYKFNFDFYCQ